MLACQSWPLYFYLYLLCFEWEKRAIPLRHKSRHFKISLDYVPYSESFFEKWHLFKGFRLRQTCCEIPGFKLAIDSLWSSLLQDMVVPSGQNAFLGYLCILNQNLEHFLKKKTTKLILNKFFFSCTRHNNRNNSRQILKVDPDLWYLEVYSAGKEFVISQNGGILYHLYSQIFHLARGHLTKKAAEKAIDAFFIYAHDFHNSLEYALPPSYVQKIRNADGNGVILHHGWSKFIGCLFLAECNIKEEKIVYI